MPRLIQAAAFFLLSAGLVVVVSPSDGAERLGVLLAGSIVAATLTHVLPWVYALDTDPVPAPRE